MRLTLDKACQNTIPKQSKIARCSDQIEEEGANGTKKPDQKSNWTLTKE